jgi:putative endonuclease
MFTVYVLYSPIHNKIYIGFSSDIEKRLFAHNHPSNKGWTKSFQPWTLIHSEEVETKADAMLREKQLKSSQGRSFIKDVILSHR